MTQQNERKRKPTPRPEPYPPQPTTDYSGCPYMVQIFFMAAMAIAFLLKVILDEGTPPDNEFAELLRDFVENLKQP